MKDEYQFGIDFDSTNLEPNLIFSVLLAPVIPGTFAQTALCWIVAFLALIHFAILIFGRKSKRGVFTSGVAKSALMISGQTTLIILLFLAWLGAAGLLWTFDSFFVIFAVIHSISTMISALIVISEYKGN